MALDAELLNLRSAGTYRFERDLSTISYDTMSYTNLRLVVGFSKTGPINTPTLVSSQAEFIKLFGNIDRSLERKGSYFHRSALVALNVAPIICLNLVNLDPDKDQVQIRTFSVNTIETNLDKVTLPLTSIYNTDKFWFVDDESFLNGVDLYLSDVTFESVVDEALPNFTQGLLHFTNINKKPISIIIKKASSLSTKGYELTLKDWYGEGEVPEYLNPTSYVSDYMVDVYVVGGDFGPETYERRLVTTRNVDEDNDYEQLKLFTNVDTLPVDHELYKETPFTRFDSDITFQEYFDGDGFIRKDRETDTTDTKLNKFLNLPAVNLIARYTGSLIPNFVDKLGKNIWIVKLINDQTTTTGLVCTENTKLLEDVDDDQLESGVINEKIDLIGHNIFAQMVSTGNLTNDKQTSLNLDFLSYKFKYTPVLQTLTITDMVKLDPDLIDSVDDDDAYVPTPITYTKLATAELDEDVDNTLAPFAWYRLSDDGEEIYTFDNSGDGGPANIVYTTSSYINSDKASVYKDPNDLTNNKISIDSFSTVNPLMTEFAVCEVNDGSDSDSVTYYTSRTFDGGIYDTVRENEVILDLSSDVTAGDYLVSYYNSGKVLDEEDGAYKQVKDPYSRLTRVVETRPIYTEGVENGVKNGKLTKTHIRVICSDAIYKYRGVADNMVVKIKPIDQLCNRLQWTCLKGFQMRKDLCPDGTNKRQNIILDMIREKPTDVSTISNLYKTLCDRDYIQWRYLVDTFGNGLEEECKKVYTLLCQGRKSALALVNCPSQADFKKSTDPSFVDSRGSVSSEFIAEGGDTTKSPEFLFSLPTLENGASWGAYFYPYLKISDLSAIKTVPPAAYVSNLFIQKYSNSQPWAIVAGQKRGVISGNQVVGVEATLIHENRDWLEPVGINSIIWENGVGVEIYANKTAKQTPKSALSSTHVREACIYIQDQIETILRRYVFEYNTAQTRLEIKTLVDNFLETVKNGDGINDYKTVMDTSNNTEDVIDSNMGIIDVYIEPVRGLEILAQRLTILRTGAIAAGNFE